jgi:hypothetical protein
MRGKGKGGRGVGGCQRIGERTSVSLISTIERKGGLLYYRILNLELILDIRSICDLHFIQRAV